MADLPAPRPFYRSRLFWLGVPGLAFLLWCWTAFAGDPVAMAWSDGNHRTFAFVGTGTVGAMRITPQRGATGPVRFQAGRGIVFSLPNATPFPSAIEVKLGKQERTGGSKVSGATVAIWALVLLYSSVWLPLVVWNQRRRARLWKASAAGTAEPPARSST